MKTDRCPSIIADLRYRRTLKKLTRFLKNYLYLILAAGTVIALIGADRAYWNYAYMDADGYMRALRVYHWLLNPSFAEQPIAESNYPFGEILHWTRPMDILWLLNTLPFLGLSNLKDTVFMAGSFLSPWLAVLTVIVLAYGLRRRFNVYLTLFGCFIFLADPVVQSYFTAARPDHHSLMALLALYSLSLTLCWLKKRHNRYLRLLGLALALMVFTAAEGLIVYALFLGFFLWLYVYQNISLLPAVKTAKYFAISITCFWLINPPYEGWFYPDNGRISILYATFSWLVFGALYGLNLSRLHTRILKLYSLLCTALGIALALLVCFGTDIYHFPLDSEISYVWSRGISEMRPIWQQRWQTALAAYTFGAAALILSFRMRRYKPYRRLMALNLCLGLPMFGLSLVALRFANYQNLYTILPFLCLLEHIYKQSPFARHRSTEYPVAVWSWSLGILLFQQLIFLPYNITAVLNPEAPRFSHTLCQNVKRIGGTLVTDNFLSPKYVWLCGVNTVGTPYHRNREGLVDNYNILNAVEDNAVIPLLLKHQVTQILVFEGQGGKSPANAESVPLLQRLISRKNIPPYLEELPSPLKNARHYRVKI